jgi:hypothetical protein
MDTLKGLSTIKAPSKGEGFLNPMMIAFIGCLRYSLKELGR